MRRALAATLVAVLLAASCGAEQAPVAVVTPDEAAPRTIALDWRETYGEADEQLVFEVRRFVVRDEAWEAEIAIENRTSVAFRLGAPERAERMFGLMLFRTDDLTELEQRAQANELPPLRGGRTFTPELPAQLAPGSSWEGTMRAPGSLPAGLHVRLVFGRLLAEADELPRGLAADISWITDHSFRL